MCCTSVAVQVARPSACPESLRIPSRPRPPCSSPFVATPEQVCPQDRERRLPMTDARSADGGGPLARHAFATDSRGGSATRHAEGSPALSRSRRTRDTRRFRADPSRPCHQALEVLVPFGWVPATSAPLRIGLTLPALKRLAAVRRDSGRSHASCSRRGCALDMTGRQWHACCASDAKSEAAMSCLTRRGAFGSHSCSCSDRRPHRRDIGGTSRDSVRPLGAQPCRRQLDERTDLAGSPATFRMKHVHRQWCRLEGL